MKRAFASQAEFDAWHGKAKAATGMPIVGRNALTGVPQPGKQRTTGLTTLASGQAEIPEAVLTARNFDKKLACLGLLTNEEKIVLGLDDPCGTGDVIVVARDGSDRNSGSVLDPVATLEHAATLVQPGDTIVVRGGVYDNGGNAYASLSVNGTAEAPITVSAFPGENPIIDGYQHPDHPRAFADGIAGETMFTIFGDHVTLRGMELRGSVGVGLRIRGNNNRIEHINSHSHHNDALYLQGSSNVVEWFDGHDCYSVVNGGNSADGIKMVWDTTNGTVGNTLRYVRAWNNSDDGIDVWDSQDTLLEYCAALNNGYGSSGNGQGFKLGANRRQLGTTLRYSVSAGNRANGFTVNIATGVTMRNSTSYANGLYGFNLWAKTAAEDGSEGWNEAHGNIALSNTVGRVFEGTPATPGPTPVHTLNTWNLDITDPRFISTDPTSPDFLALAAGSPCIGAGPDGSDLGAIPFGKRFPLDLGVFSDQVGGTPP